MTTAEVLCEVPMMLAVPRDSPLPDRVATRPTLISFGPLSGS